MDKCLETHVSYQKLIPREIENLKEKKKGRKKQRLNQKSKLSQQKNV